MHNFYKYLKYKNLYNDLKIELEGGMRNKPPPTATLTPLQPPQSSQICIRPFCGKSSYQGKPGNFCSIYCRDCKICPRPGCQRISYNGVPGEFCSKSCKYNTSSTSSSTNQPPSDSSTNQPFLKNPYIYSCCNPSLKDVGFFYKPNDKLDKINGLGFLGNFYEHNPNGFNFMGKQFKCAEGAFQSLKDFKNVDSYTQLNGDGAFRMSRNNKNIDMTYNGLGSNWAAMLHVLIAKFSDPILQQQIVDCAPPFLLEHNEISGRDTTWSDNKDGTGSNWLGLQLMLIRKYIYEIKELNELKTIPLPTDLNNFAETNLGINDYTRWVKYYAEELNKLGL
jgi:predicted NAD-dependent protein-ADP-ribosyltransferase YbiA (DUF1768 family)